MCQATWHNFSVHSQSYYLFIQAFPHLEGSSSVFTLSYHSLIVIIVILSSHSGYLADKDYSLGLRHSLQIYDLDCWFLHNFWSFEPDRSCLLSELCLASGTLLLEETCVQQMWRALWHCPGVCLDNTDGQAPSTIPKERLMPQDGQRLPER